MIRRAFPSSIALASLLLATTARAQHRPGIDASTWRPSTDPGASLVGEPVVTPGPTVVTLGAYAQYAFHPITLRDPGTNEVALRPLAHQLMLTPMGNIGIGDRLAFGGSLPVVVYQDGTRPLPASVSDSQSVPHSTIGDLAFHGKATILKNDQGGFGLAALATLTLPTGSRDDFVSEDGPTISGRIIAEYTLLVASAQASLGYKFRAEPRTWPDQDAGGVRFGNELPWTFAVAMRPGVLGIDPRNRQRIELGFHGWLPAGPVGPFGIGGDKGATALSPVQLALSDKIEVGHYRDLFVTLGGELGLTQAVGVPVFRAIAGIGWTPRAHDMDHDGVQDDVDGCPEIPEDKDGFEDSDGCPDVDNDQDGIIDREDACPNVKGYESKDPTINGCPAAKPPEPPPPPPKVEEPPAPPAPPEDPDRDGDTFRNDEDKCPDEAEVFNGVDDTDGCPDEGGKPLVTIDDKPHRIKLAAPLKFAGTKDVPEVDPASIPTLRALGLELNKRPSLSVAVGAKPLPGETQLDALARAFAVVRVLSDFAHHDGAAETIGWDAVKAHAGTENVGFLLLVSPEAAKVTP